MKSKHFCIELQLAHRREINPISALSTLTGFPSFFFLYFLLATGLAEVGRRSLRIFNVSLRLSHYNSPFCIYGSIMRQFEFCIWWGIFFFETERERENWLHIIRVGGLLCDGNQFVHWLIRNWGCFLCDMCQMSRFLMLSFSFLLIEKKEKQQCHILSQQTKISPT